MRMLNLLVEKTSDDTEGEDELSVSSKSNRKKILKLCSHIPPGSMSGFCRRLFARPRLVALLESARSTPGL